MFVYANIVQRLLTKQI